MKVTIENHDGRLRLRWQYQGKRYGFACGVKADAMGMSVARMRAAEIERDIQAGYFDPTLLKYKPQRLGRNGTDITAPELFHRFTQHQQRSKGLAASTVEAKYKPLGGSLARWLNVSASQVTSRRAEDFASLCMERLNPRTAKERLWLLSSCWQWAKGQYQIVDPNPWEGLASRIKIAPTQKVRPFSRAEITAILGCFQTHRYYRHYYDFVCFLFGTGCRIGEAVGLKWKHISPDFRTVWIGETLTRGMRRSTTKNRKDRTIILTEKLSEILRQRSIGRDPKPDELVFPAPKGGAICDQLFNRRAWRTVLAKMNIEYRKPYSVRHSAISHALAGGSHYLDIASQTGHDPQILFRSCASTIETKSVF